MADGEGAHQAPSNQGFPIPGCAPPEAATIDLVQRMDRAELAAFLRRRREALQPHDVGLHAGPRRRTAGLRREEVAALAGMSADYYSRMEQQRGPQPSPQMLAALARGLRLTLDERDHLFRLAGHAAPTRVRRSDHVHPALLRVLDRLDDTPAQVITANTTGEALLVEGRWRITGETFCTIVRRGGITCPNR